jgi:hypothetical protein
LDGLLAWAKWFYARCIETPGGDLACFQAYSIAGVVLLCLVGAVLVIIARRAYYGWKEEARNRARLEARKGVAAAEVMSQHKWSGDASEGEDLPYDEMVRRIREHKKNSRKA